MNERVRRRLFAPQRRGVPGLVLLAFALLACRLLLAFALIPLWQQPDETTHVARAELERSRIARSRDKASALRDSEILESMATHDWWKHRAIAFPSPLETPTSFRTLNSFRVFGPIESVSEPPAYTIAAGRLLSWLPPMSIAEEVYALRAASAVLGVLTLLMAWFASRETLGPSGGATVTLLLALHPQFSIGSTAASPDPAAYFFGACLWWQAAVALRGRRLVVPIAVLWTAAIAAATADRVGVPLLALALTVSVVVVAMRVPLRRRSVALLLTGIAGSVAVLGAAAWSLSSFGGTYAIPSVFSGGLTPVPGAMTWDRFARFSWSLHESWWYSIGWGRYGPPGWWMVAAGAITTAAVVGLARRCFSDRALDARTCTLLVAAAGIAIQLAAIYLTYFRLGTGAQGRYLFPVLVPSLVLLWTGIEAWAPPARRVHAAAALVLLFALLDAAGWLLVALPAYYASL